MHFPVEEDDDGSSPFGLAKLSPPQAALTKGETFMFALKSTNTPAT